MKCYETMKIFRKQNKNKAQYKDNVMTLLSHSEKLYQKINLTHLIIN